MDRKGMTLIEIMIVVALIAIMAAVATAIYRPYIRKARRSDAFTALKACYTAQEMYKAENGQYATSFSDLSGCNSTSAGEYYSLNMTTYDNATRFSFWANPLGSQSEDWALCIDEQGREYASKDPNAVGPCPGGSWNETEWEKL